MARAVVGVGGYGCIVHPAFDCPGARMPDSFVSKLTLVPESDIVHAELQRIDPDQHYLLFASPRNTCLLRESDELSSAVRACNAFAKKELLRDGVPLANAGMSMAWTTLGTDMTGTFSDLYPEIPVELLTPLTNWYMCMNAMHRIFTGVALLHDHGITHNDIKYVNIMIMRDGTMRLIDFGRAQVRTQTVFHVRTFNAPPELRVAPAEIDKSHTMYLAFLDAKRNKLLHGRFLYATKPADVTERYNIRYHDMYALAQATLVPTVPSESDIPESYKIFIRWAMDPNWMNRYSFADFFLGWKAVMADVVEYLSRMFAGNDVALRHFAVARNPEADEAGRAGGASGGAGSAGAAEEDAVEISSSLSSVSSYGGVVASRFSGVRGAFRWYL